VKEVEEERKKKTRSDSSIMSPSVESPRSTTAAKSPASFSSLTSLEEAELGEVDDGCAARLHQQQRRGLNHL
jgi:hypothetical protein